jgi:hypothetical protein
MKHHFQKKAKYTALILASSLPFSAEVLADVEKKIGVESLSITDKNLSPSKNNVSAEDSQQVVINETRDFLSGIQQALLALEKNDTKEALTILQDLSKNLPVFLDKNPTLALVTAEMEADTLYIEGNAKTVKKELKQINDLLNNETLQSAFLSVPFYKRLKMQQHLIDAGNTY